jgi:predicted SAM-dependent methyltransferase
MGSTNINRMEGFEKEKKHYTALPTGLLQKSPLMLNLGGYNEHPGWVNVNIQPSSYNNKFVAEVLRGIDDLFGIPDEVVDALYCSHALEHMKIAQVEDTLREWNRVLKPGGLLFVSVPDLKVMARYV